MLTLSKYSCGVGDRFAHQAEAQLQAFVRARQQGVEIIPVWNKSYREHTTVGSQPASVREAADRAVRKLGWELPYHVDADHIRLETVGGFLAASDYYTIDVADSIGQPASAGDVAALVARHENLVGKLTIPGIDQPFTIGRADLERIARQYLLAVQQAGRIYREIARQKGAGSFITEVSMDETVNPQTPPELLVILAAIADEEIPVQTIAPKFTGRFNKGVDYVGDISQFEREFSQDLAVIRFAVQQFALPANLKLSVHSGSDKFSIYAPIRRSLARFDAGVHVKTAGTTWLEEVIGLAEADGAGLQLAKEIYVVAHKKREALCAPYATVIDIDGSRLPAVDEVEAWSAGQFVRALRHDPACTEFNPHLRQLIHVGYKVAAEMGPRYLQMLDECRSSIARNVTRNLFERHMQPLFLA